MGVAGLVILKKRIKSIENTKKLTKAMALVATSKLKKVRVSLYTNDTYFKSYREVMNEVIPSLPKENRYMQSNGSKKKLIIVITSDMGMCGAYNNNVIDKLNESSEKMNENKEKLVDLMQNLSAIAEENAAGTEEASAAIEEQSASIEEIANGSEGLVNIIDELQGIINKFTV